MSADDTQPLKSQRRPGNWKRRIVLGTLSAIVLAIGGGQLLLWSDLPRRVAIAALEKQFGLSVSIQSLSTGWFGRSTLRQSSFSLPLRGEPLARVQEMRVRHTSLIAMILGRSVEIDSVEMDRPQITVKPDADGVWNLREAVDLIARARQSSRGGAPSAPITAGSLPNLRIEGATVRIADLLGNEAILTPLKVSGQRQGRFVYSLTASCGQNLQVDATLVPGGTWLHEGGIRIEDAGQWVRPFVRAWPDASELAARWSGQFDGEGVRGRLEIATAVFGDLIASGAVQANATAQGMSLRPSRLLVRGLPVVEEELRIVGGTIMLDARRLQAQSLLVVGTQGNIEISGFWDRIAQTAEADAKWHNLRLTTASRHSGSLHAALQTAFPRRPQLLAAVHSSGTVNPDATWDLELELQADGESFANLNWRVHGARAVYTQQRRFDLTGFTAQGRTVGLSRLILDDISIPQRGRLTGRGEIDLGAGNWWCWLSGGDFAVAGDGEPALTFDLNTWGDFEGATIDKLYVSAGELELWTTGVYDRKLAEPLVLDLWLTQSPELGQPQSQWLRGRLRAELHLVGRSPLDLEMGGLLHARDLVVRHRRVGDIDAVVNGRLERDWLRLQTRELELFRAKWNVTARWPTLDARQALELAVGFDELPLEEIAELVGQPQLRGTASGTLDLKLPSSGSDQLRASGAFHATGLALGPWRANDATIHLTAQNGRVRVDPILLKEDDGSIRAVAEADLVRPQFWHVTASIQDWPMKLGQSDDRVICRGQTRQLAVNLATAEAFGDALISARFVRGGTQLGFASAGVVADGRVLHATRIDAQLLAGTVQGWLTFDRDHPVNSTAMIEMRELDISQLQQWFAELGQGPQLRGKVTGSFTAQRDPDPRALAPLGFTLQLASPDAVFGVVPVRSLAMTGFANFDQPVKRLHLVTPDATAELADGKVDLFARMTIRRDGTQAMLITGNFEHLNLDQIVHAFAPDADPMPGRLAGRFTLGGDPRLPRHVLGEITLSLSETDLINSDAVGFLYNAMRIGASSAPSAGGGSARARLEGGNLNISRFYYFNRGTEVRGAGTIRNVFSLPNSPVSMMLVGTARPLRDLRLPFMADIDQVLATVQANATTVEVTGTVAEPRVRLTTFDSLTRPMRSLLLGDIGRQRTQ